VTAVFDQLDNQSVSYLLSRSREVIVEVVNAVHLQQLIGFRA